ncbi:MAG: protease pro-enzyme activation domain-containing protein [Edaphobacter sp.]
MSSRRFAILFAPALLLSALTSLAQAPPQNRIASAINGGNRVAMPGTISSHVKHSADLGAAQANLKLGGLTLRFSMTAAQQADLNQLLAAQLNPSSPSYHQWLTPEQFGARFGLSSSDIAKVSSWLTGQGFTVTGVARSSTFINFSGTVAQAEQAFGTSIHTLSYNGEQHISNVTDPVLPASVAAVAGSIIGLDDFRMKPHSRPRNASPINPAQPLFTQTVGTTTSHYIAPADIYTIYDYPWTAAGVTSATNTGAGITIGIMGQTDLNTGNVLPDASVTAFRSAAGLPAIKLTAQRVPGTPDPGISQPDVDEAHIDVEWSGAAAPGANILFVYSAPQPVAGGVFQALTYAIDNRLAPILSVSYGLCESAWGTAALASNNLLLAQANVQGQTVISSSGDSGATDCDVAGDASEGLTVDFPGSSPYVTSAGGTMFSGDVSVPATYWSSSNGTGSGSAISYIPEVPWNETTSSGGLTAGGAGGGGVSAYFSKPAWQTGTGVPTDGSRDVPDFSFNAATFHDGYLACSAGDGMGEPACTSGFVGSGNLVNVFGGTSFVAPSFAGVLALVEQKLGNTIGLGNVGPTLYGFLTGPTYTSVFHDITSGNNSVPCAQGTLNCPNGGSIGFSATTGYDQASGIGTIDVSKLVNGWASVIPTGTGSSIGAGITTTSVATTSNLCGISTSTTLPLTVTVSPSPSGGASPTGTVAIQVDNQTITTQALSGGSASIQLNLSSVTSGGHVISAVYSGDGNYAGSKGTLLQPASTSAVSSDGIVAYPNGAYASVDFVSGSKADFVITPCVNASAGVSVLPGATSSGLTFTITPVNGFTGTINLAAVNNDGMISTSTFTPTSVNITSAAGTSSFVVQAFGTVTAHLVKPSLTPSHQQPSGKTPWYTAASGATLAGLLLFTLPRRRRWSSLFILMLFAAALTAVGCGSSSSNTGGGGSGGGGGGGGGGQISNSATGTYTFTITAVSGSLVHSTQVTVNVP